MAMMKAERIAELRREAIGLAISIHLDRERADGTSVAVEHAISRLIGAAEFLALRIGKEKAKATLMQLHDAI